MTMDIDRALADAVDRYQNDDLGAAREICERVLASAPNHSGARHLLAATLLDAGNASAARRLLDVLIGETPDYISARYDLGRALASLGEVDGAIAEFNRVVDAEPSFIIAYLAMEDLFLAQGRKDDAIALLRRALEAMPDNPDILNNLGTLMNDIGRHDEAVSLLERATSAVVADDAIVRFNLALALRAAGRPDEAVEQYRRATELDPNMTEAWFNLGNLLMKKARIDEAATAFDRAHLSLRLLDAPDRALPTFTTASRTKLRHDREQLAHLIDRGLLENDPVQQVRAYDDALNAIPLSVADNTIVNLPAVQNPRFVRSYNRLTHSAQAPALSAGALNPDLDHAAIEADYARNGPGITHIDSLLRPEALDSLRRFCLESTIWYKFDYPGGYVGSDFADGFNCPLLVQIAEELRVAFPAIFRTTTLSEMWSFKYDSRLTGIPIHADYAAVNVNFWVTPDEANLNPESGGLVVWDKKAPADWDFETYNANEPAARKFLAASEAQSVNIPYRCNRAAVFNSDLFHETGDIHFKDGYENRRINVTMLFGLRNE